MQRNNLPDHVGSPEERPCAYKATIHHGVSVVWGLDCGLDTDRGSAADADTAAMSQKT